MRGVRDSWSPCWSRQASYDHRSRSTRPRCRGAACADRLRRQRSSGVPEPALAASRPGARPIRARARKCARRCRSPSRLQTHGALRASHYARSRTRPDVGALVLARPACLLGAHVSRRAGIRPSAVPSSEARRPRDATVPELRPASSASPKSSTFARTSPGHRACGLLQDVFAERGIGVGRSPMVSMDSQGASAICRATLACFRRSAAARSSPIGQRRPLRRASSDSARDAVALFNAVRSRRRVGD